MTALKKLSTALLAVTLTAPSLAQTANTQNGDSTANKNSDIKSQEVTQRILSAFEPSCQNTHDKRGQVCTTSYVMEETIKTLKKSTAQGSPYQSCASPFNSFSLFPDPRASIPSNHCVPGPMVYPSADYYTTQSRRFAVAETCTTTEKDKTCDSVRVEIPSKLSPP